MKVIMINDSDEQTKKYAGTDELEAMRFAKNYNQMLVDLIAFRDIYNLR